MPLFVCRCCAEDPCELRTLGKCAIALPDVCPFGLNADPLWRAVPSVRSPLPGADLVPGPFCEIPARIIARATACHGRYTIEIGGVDRLEIEVSRAAFNEAVKAMEAVGRDAME